MGNLPMKRAKSKKSVFTLGEPKMTAQEFQAWLEGFEEVLEGKVPNKKQWGKIRNKIKMLQRSSDYTYPHYYWSNEPYRSDWSVQTTATIPFESSIITDSPDIGRTNIGRSDAAS